MSSPYRGPEDIVGRTFAGYRLNKVIGIGASGAVYLGRATRRGRPAAQESVAIKVLGGLPWKMSTQERGAFRARFEREAKVLKRLSHPHILRLIDYGEQGGDLYMMLPYMAGGTLADLAAARNRPLRQDEVAKLGIQLANAVDYAHRQGVIHRDIKPANVLLDGAKKNVFLADFSIARLIEETTAHLTRTGQPMGTDGYMAPEQRAGEVAGKAADIYSLGAVLYELVTGQRAKARNAAPAASLVADLPSEASDALARALAEAPEDRFQSARAFIEEFVRGIGREDLLTEVMEGPTLMPSPQPRTRLALSTLGKRIQTLRKPKALPAALATALIVGLLAVLLAGEAGVFAPKPRTTVGGKPAATVGGKPAATRTATRPLGTATASATTGTTTGTGPASSNPTPTLTPTPLIDRAQVSNIGTGEQNPGASFSVTFTAKNSGTTTWSPGTGYVFVCVANCYGAGTQTLNGSVGPGQSATFSVGMTEPNGSANILNQNFSQSTSTWQMQHNGATFGNQSSVAVATHGWITAYGPTTPCAGSNGWVQFKPSAGCGTLQTTSASFPEMDLQGSLVSNSGQFRMETHFDMTTNNSGNYEPGLVIDTPQAPALGGAEFGARANGTWTVWKCCNGNIPVVVAQSATSPSTSYDLAVVIYGGIAHFYVNGGEVFSTATGNLNLSGNEQGVIQWWNVQSSNDTSSWSNFQLANWG